MWSFLYPCVGLTEFSNGQLQYFLNDVWTNSHSHTQTLEKQYKQQFCPGFSYQGKKENYWFPPSGLTLHRIRHTHALLTQSFCFHFNTSFHWEHVSFRRSNHNILQMTVWKVFSTEIIFKSEKLWLFRYSTLMIRKVNINYSLDLWAVNETFALMLMGILCFNFHCFRKVFLYKGHVSFYCISVVIFFCL